jgi:helicase
MLHVRLMEKMTGQRSASVCNQRITSPIQQEILESGLLTSGFNCILQMPTGSGKTWLAEQAIASVLDKGKRAIYIAPLRALADELNTRWQTHYAPNKVGVFTGDYVNSSYPVPYQDSQLLVMTPEKLDACIRNWRSHWNWIPEVDLVVIDEFHLLGDPRRGARLEGVLLRLMRLNPFLRILGLSATLGNRYELANWLKGVEYHSNWRPIPLTWKVVRYKKSQDKPDLLLRAVNQNLAQEGKSLIFVHSRRRAEEIATLLQKAGCKAEHHHAGLTHSHRHQVEDKFRHNQLDVLVATATLEMGLNLPVRQVILYDLQIFDGVDFAPLPVNNVWQRAGRAGRPGLDETGEVVLLAPNWDGQVDHYSKGKFEPIRSGLANPSAVAEQIITEVASGLCKFKTQLEIVFNHSLAAQQGTLVSIPKIVAQMLEAGMLQELEINEVLQLKATRLGWIAVRHLLTPETVLLFRKVLADGQQLTFLDLLLLVVSCEDCEPILPVDFEQLDFLNDQLRYEPSLILNLSREQIKELLGIDGKRLLAALNTALVIRNWTRLGDANQVAEQHSCYVFEIHRLCESMSRLLQAMSAVLSAMEINKDKLEDPEIIPLRERIQALLRMVSGGLNEQVITLTVVPGIGAKLAQRLQQFGIHDIEDLALAVTTELADLQGVSPKRAKDWIEFAAEIVDSRWSANRYREEKTENQLKSTNLPTEIDPYRLRRALSLQVFIHSKGIYRVTGGLDPHTVKLKWGNFSCDCLDFAKGYTCKHILAVRLQQGDSELQKFSLSFHQLAENTELNLLDLWMGNHR